MAPERTFRLYVDFLAKAQHLGRLWFEPTAQLMERIFERPPKPPPLHPALAPYEEARDALLTAFIEDLRNP